MTSSSRAFLTAYDAYAYAYMKDVTVKTAFGFIVTVTLAFCSLTAAASSPSYLKDVRYSSSPNGSTRVVLDLSQAISFTSQLADDQQSVFIVLKDCEDRSHKDAMMLKSPLVRQVRINNQEESRSLVVRISLNRMVDYKIFTLKPELDKPHRIVLDFFQPKDHQELQPKVTEVEPGDIGAKPGGIGAEPKVIGVEKNHEQGDNDGRGKGDRDIKQENIKREESNTRAGKKKVVVIDPGHGGEDPGAIGSNGTREKDVVLQLARELKSYLNQHFPEIQVHLTRDGDYFIPLRKRILIAHRHHADLFISLHANASRKKDVQGASVYYLSETSASDRASRLLAARENSSDLIAGVKLSKDKEVNTILIDLVQTYTTSESIRICNATLDGLHSSGFHNKGVKCANFAVLKSPSIPSALLEIGYITNRQDEKKLISQEFQRQIARQIGKSVWVCLMGGMHEEPTSPESPDVHGKAKAEADTPRF
ncbi:MAG: N-acetylmuramoyl-L-alanine amidase [bacterium]